MLELEKSRFGNDAAAPQHLALSTQHCVDFYGRMSIRRLEAEAIRDRMLVASGSLNRKMFGPPVPVREDGVGQIIVGKEQKRASNQPGPMESLGGEENRRSVYIQVRRSQPLAMLRTFDAPVMETNCERRPVSTVAPQALMLMNSDFALEQATLFAARLHREAGAEPKNQIAHAWQIAYARPATEIEVTQALDFLARQRQEIDRLQPSSPPKEAKPKDAKSKAPETPKPDRTLQALTDLCQALLSSNEFLYVE